MKFWRQSLIASISFLAVSFSVVYTSCTEDTCTKLNCRNGGTCVDGYCKCPTGWEGLQCEKRSFERYVGFYDGTTTVDDLPPVIDSAVIRDENNAKGVATPNNINFRRYTRINDVIHLVIGADGKIYQNDTGYGGRRISIVEENNKIQFVSIEKNAQGKEQTFRFIGTRRDIKVF